MSGGMDDKLKHWVVTGDKLSTPLGRTPGGRFHASIRRIPTALRLEQWPEIINDVYRCDESWQDDNSRARTAQRQEEKKKTHVSYRVGACDNKDDALHTLVPVLLLVYPSPLYPSSDLEGGRKACARGGGDTTSTVPATDGCMRAWGGGAPRGSQLAAVVALESVRATGDGDCVCARVQRTSMVRWSRRTRVHTARGVIGDDAECRECERERHGADASPLSSSFFSSALPLPLGSPSISPRLTSPFCPLPLATPFYLFSTLRAALSTHSFPPSPPPSSSLPRLAHSPPSSAASPSPSPLIFHPVPFALRCPPGCLIPKCARGGGTMRVRVRVRVRDGVSGDGEMRACTCGTRVIAMGGICAALRAAAVPVSVLEGGGGSVHAAVRMRLGRRSPYAIGEDVHASDGGNMCCASGGVHGELQSVRNRGWCAYMCQRWRGGERARTRAVGAVSGAVLGRNWDPCVRYASGEEGGKGAGGARWNGTGSGERWQRRVRHGEGTQGACASGVLASAGGASWSAKGSCAAAVATGSGWHITACASGGARTALSTQRSADALTAWTGGANSGSCTVWPIRKCTEKATRVGISPPSIPCNFSSLLLIQDLQSQISKLVY
ncbi:hypothetical protein DFH06DRAFT_1148064 [Mycena polygramma]|nr:hypothetical protein DFH06DRAFT_1148064 [Mycena polygramma]